MKFVAVRYAVIFKIVTTCVVVWIEIVRNFYPVCCVPVTTCVVVWIEI